MTARLSDITFMEQHRKISAETGARQTLARLRDPLFELHRLVLEEVRARHERDAGPVSPQQFFRLLLDSPQFQWLRPFSGLLSAIDEVLDKPPEDPAVYDEVLTRAEHLFRFTAEDETTFTAAYKDFLQASTEIAACHGEVRQLLPKRGAQLS